MSYFQQQQKEIIKMHFLKNVNYDPDSGRKKKSREKWKFGPDVNGAEKVQ